MAVLLMAWGAVDSVRLSVRGLWRRSPSDAWIDGALVCGCLGSVGFYVVASVPGQDVARVRYLLPALVFGAVMAGRRLARVNWGRVGIPPRGPRRALVNVGLAAVLAAYALTAAGLVQNRNRPDPNEQLARWLVTHGLTQGWSDYWTASMTTVLSDNRVHVRAVIAHDGRLHAYGRVADSSWFSPHASSMFLAYRPAAPFGGVDDVSALSTFGQPVATEHVGPFKILVWDHDTATSLGRLVVG
jgi:hypothetical protein